MINENIKEASRMFAIEMISDNIIGQAELSKSMISFLYKVKAGNASNSDSLFNQAKQKELSTDGQGNIPILTQKGEKTIEMLENAQNMLSEKCIEWLSDTTKGREKEILGTSAGKLYEGFKNGVRTKDVSEILKVIVLNEKERDTYPPKIKWILSELVRYQFSHSGNAPCPILQRIYFELIGKTLDSIEIGENETLCILIDTNVLIDLTTPGRSLRRSALRVWDTLEELNKGSVKFYISFLTLEEFRKVIKSSSDTIMNINVKSMREKEIEDDDVNKLGSIEIEFLDDPQAPTFSDFADMKVDQILGYSDITDIGNWEVELINLKPLVAKKREDAIKLLRDSKRSMYRTWLADRHDVSLLLFANEKNMMSHQSKERWIVWTHHHLLANFADTLKVSNMVACYGPNICLLAEAMNLEPAIEGMKNIYREYMMAQFSAAKPSVSMIRQMLSEYLQAESLSLFSTPRRILLNRMNAGFTHLTNPTLG